MKKLAFLIFFLFLTSILYADDIVYNVDLDNDGVEELIKVEKLYETIIEGREPIQLGGIISVSSPDESKIGSFKLTDRVGEVDFISLNNDGLKQIVSWGSGGAHYTSLAIYGYKDNKFYKIFENGSACPIEVDFDATPPTIRVGWAKWGEKILTEDGEEIEWSYASGGHGDCYWEVYTWNGENFICDEGLSTVPKAVKEQFK